MALKFEHVFRYLENQKRQVLGFLMLEKHNVGGFVAWVLRWC